VSPVIAIILVVAIPAVLASVLYVSVSGTLTGGALVGPSGGHSCTGPQVSIRATDTGWIAEILTIVPGIRPAEMTLEVRASNGNMILEKTTLSGFRPESGAAYVDRNPKVDEVRPGDGIDFDGARFPEGSTIAISDRTGMITVQTLR